MAICTCGGAHDEDPKWEGHWLGCASWSVPSFNARLTDKQRDQRAAIFSGLKQRRIDALRAEADALEKLP